MKDELTTDEIFQESMKLSELAWKEKGERLEEYRKWLRTKWKYIGDERFHHNPLDEEGLTARGEDKLRRDQENEPNKS